MNFRPNITRCIVFSFALPLAAFAASTAPRPIDPTGPAYPEALHAKLIEGQATIACTITATGDVTDASVKTADDPAFGIAALAAVEQWKFEPATVDGVAVDKKILVPLVFKVPAALRLNMALKRDVFVAPPETVYKINELDEKPKGPVKRVKPVYPPKLKGHPDEVTIRMKFIVTPTGEVINPEPIGKDVPREFYFPAIYTISGFKFEAPKKDGKPVYAERVMPLKFSKNPPRPQGGGGGGGGGGGYGGDGGGGGGGGGGGDY